MKKISLLFLMGFSAIFSAKAQYWMIPNPSAGNNPGGLNTYVEQPSTAAAPWTTIQTTSATAAWSPVQTIPFTFQFNGVTETSFKVSTSGVLTFDVATALAAPASTNAALPNAAVPDKSVCVWGLQGTGANDKIITTVLGTAPNRQLWVSFNSYSHASSASVYTYWSIVLEETSNKIHIIDQRTGNSTGAAVTLNLSAGLQFTSTSAMSVPGSPSLNSSSNPSIDDASDNSYWTFVPGTQPADEIQLVDVTPHDGAPASYVVSPGNLPLSAKVVNYGTNTITGFTFTYDDGSGPVSDVKTGLNIAPFQTYTFTVSPSVPVTANVHKTINCVVSMAGDADMMNNYFVTGVTGAAFNPVHYVTFEEATGTWCGWCPRGAVYMDSIHKVKSDAVVIAVHNNDPMTETSYDAGIGGFISGYPSIVVDRKETDDPSAAFAQYTLHKPDFGYADITVSNSLSGMTLTSEVSCHFAVDLAGSYRLAYVVTEDNVTGTDAGYNQTNYYSSSSQNIALNGASHVWQSEPNPVPAAKMEYDFVARVIDNTFTGRANTITSPVTAGSTQSYTFNYTLPAGSIPTDFNAIALLIDQTSGMILNANQSRVNFANNVASTELQNNTYMYPNPATDRVSVYVQSNKGSNFRVDVVNMLGQVVLSQTSTAATGNVVLNTTDLTAGQYMVRVSNGAEQTTMKLTKN